MQCVYLFCLAKKKKKKKKTERKWKGFLSLSFIKPSCECCYSAYSLILQVIQFFYPTALKGCRGIVFTDGVRMGRQAGGQREKVCPGCISETVRCRKLILGRDIG